jgi:hypothetical protein
MYKILYKNEGCLHGLDKQKQNSNQGWHKPKHTILESVKACGIENESQKENEN